MTRISQTVEAALARGATLALYVATLLVAALLRERSGSRSHLRRPGKMRLLLTGTFYNENWFRAHILPLTRSAALRRIWVVADQPLFPVDKVAYVSPPALLRRLCGRTLARALMVFWTTARVRPDLLMGYHIMPNALLCLWSARLFGGRALYQMTGGPAQVVGGGAFSENALLRRLRTASPVLEACLYAVLRQFDVIVTRGNQARAFLDQHRLARRSVVITGSIDTARFSPNGTQREFDLVYVSRLVRDKGLEYFLEVLAQLAALRPVRAAIVGDGPLRPLLATRAKELGLNGELRFLGHADDVVPVLRRSRVFVLTSPSEGMSIALLEAQGTGLPAAVTPVGELADAVREGVTGTLLKEKDAAAAAGALARLLDDRAALQTMAQAARRQVEGTYSVAAMAGRWNAFFEGLAAERHGCNGRN